MAENPEPPNRDVAPPNGLEVVLVEPKRPPLLLVLVPKPEERVHVITGRTEGESEQLLQIHNNVFLIFT